MAGEDIKEEIASRVLLPEFPRSSRYDPQWQLDNSLDPALWYAELLSEVMSFTPGMRVLDLGCGRAITSIFLAREFGVSVVAADLLPVQHENWARILDAGCADSVLPVQADARHLMFANGYFDAVVGIDSFSLFATDDHFPRELLRYVRPGGQVGFIGPGVTTEFEGRVPADMLDYWDPNFNAIHTPGWWARKFNDSGWADVVTAELIPDGWRYWLAWEQLVADLGPLDVREAYARTANGLKRDAGRTFGLARVVITRRSWGTWARPAQLAESGGTA